MIADTLLKELQNLNRAEKWEVIQVLMTDLADEEKTILHHGNVYEIWSPFDAPQAAATLSQMVADVCFYRSQNRFEINTKDSGTVS